MDGSGGGRIWLVDGRAIAGCQFGEGEAELAGCCGRLERTRLEREEETGEGKRDRRGETERARFD